MFTLTSIELDNAVAAISHHGYSAMLPDPPEWQLITQNWPSVRVTLEKLDLDIYEPFNSLRIFAPKSRANVRITHLLHPQDLIIYTALVLITKNDIEGSHLSGRSRRVFSYRTDANSQTLYRSKGSFESYKSELARKASRSSTKYVAIADIADFYPRIYQHRLENVIETVATTDRVREVARVLVRKLICNLMGRNSYGIPVGPYASRLLGEAVLIDVDASLQSQGVDFVRWVDDYNIFCKSEYEAQAILFSLGEWLFLNHGLTLQSAKTKILPVTRFKSEILLTPENSLDDRDTVVNLLKNFRSEYDDEEEDEDPDSEKVEEILAALQGNRLLTILRSSLEDTALIDYEAVRYALTKLPQIPGVPTELKHEVLDIVIENAQLLYPVSEHIAKYVISFDDLTPADRNRIAAKLLKPLRSKRHPPPLYYAMWILHVFSTSAQWNHSRHMVPIYKRSTSDVIKRHAALVIHKSGTRAEALAVKDDYGGASPLLQLALLFAAQKLGNDERKHWKISNGVRGVIEKLV